MSTEKAKQAPQSLIRRITNYVPLLIALGLVGAWMWFVVYTDDFLQSSGIFYPLVEWHWPTLFGIGVIGITILHAIAMARGANLIISIMSLLAMCGVVSLFAFLLAISRPTAKQVDTLIFNGSLYRLFHVSHKFRWDYPADAYTLLECNASGRWCHEYETPYFYDRPCSLFSLDAHLEIDEDINELVLYVGGTKYLMMPPAGYTSRCPQSER